MEEGETKLCPPLLRAEPSITFYILLSLLRSLFRRFYKQQPMFHRRGRREIGLRNKGDNFGFH